MIEEFERIILTEDLPGTDLRKGDVGVVVEIYNEGEGYEVAFFALNGETVAVDPEKKPSASGYQKRNFKRPEYRSSLRSSPLWRKP